MIDQLTKRWIKNASDERAARDGCRFDESRADHVCKFIETNLCLYEGDKAGQLVRLMDWQVEMFSRLFGWEKMSEDWGRTLRRFRKASIWLPKKSGKSPTAAMTGLYLLIADGEQGQKVFSAAKDGKQASIMHTHARMMVQKSPALDAECKINKSTGRILHLPTTSFYDILAADNITGQEGINGSVVIDETHVVDDRLAKTIEYAGASRAEPIQAEFSTAGDNPMGYGKKQCDYGAKVEKGEIHDEQFFYMFFGAPQDATDEQCKDPAIWAKANPSMGHTIKLGEMRAACDRASRSIGDFATFKKYRLNIWQQSNNPWLRQEDWEKCFRDFDAESLIGRECWAGMDLSKTRDMSAFVLAFPDGESEYKVLPFFWLPKQEIATRAEMSPNYMEWVAQGHLRECGDRTIDQRVIYQGIKTLSEKFSIQQIFYDATFAEVLTADIEDDLGIERVEVNQYSGIRSATETVEGLVMAHNLHHNHHPILDWQAGHVEAKSHPRGGKLLLKPQGKDDWRKIDGMVAMTMAIDGATRRAATDTYDNWYTPGVMSGQ